MGKQFFFLLLLTIGACHSARQVQESVAPSLYRHWIHSFEEDSGATMVFRPADYDFPPARGREGMEFRQDGVFIRYAIGPTDVPQRETGRWEKQGQQTLRIFPGDAEKAPYTLRIIEVRDDKLTIEKQ